MASISASVEFFYHPLDTFRDGAPIFIFVTPVRKGRRIARKNLELFQSGNVLPSTIFQDIRDQFRLTIDLPLDCGIEFCQNAEVRRKEIAAQLTDNDVSRL